MNPHCYSFLWRHTGGLLAVPLAVCSCGKGSDEAQRDRTELGMKQQMAAQVLAFQTAAEELERAAPTPSGRGWDAAQDAQGTILVKSVKKDAGKQDIFAMVKRGDGNAKGAPGWERFELTRRPDDSLAIVWRGLNPPYDHGYGGAPTGGCNSCHQIAVKNDFVHASALVLSKI